MLKISHIQSPFIESIGAEFNQLPRPQFSGNELRMRFGLAIPYVEDTDFQQKIHLPGIRGKQVVDLRQENVREDHNPNLVYGFRAGIFIKRTGDVFDKLFSAQIRMFPIEEYLEHTKSNGWDKVGFYDSNETELSSATDYIVAQAILCSVIKKPASLQVRRAASYFTGQAGPRRLIR